MKRKTKIKVVKIKGNLLRSVVKLVDSLYNKESSETRKEDKK